MKKALIFILPFILGGCLYVNERGISTEYYNGCKEYYDAMGIYHKVCDKNLVEYKDVKDSAIKTYDSTKKVITNGYKAMQQEVQ